MTGKQLKEALRAGRRVYGTLIVSTSPRWVVPVKSLGLDFVFIDTEHIALDRETLSWMCHAYREAGLAPIVRIPSPDPYAAGRVIDGGAAGVVAPYIESAAQVRQLIGAIAYRPLKGERLRALLANPEAIDEELRRYLKHHNEEHLFIANIESCPALEALDDILSVDELDGVLIGPHDLSCSLDIPERYQAAAFVEAVERIIGRARALGKGAGIHMVYDEDVRHEIRFARLGANLILHSADILLFQKALREDLASLRAALDDEVKGNRTARINI